MDANTAEALRVGARPNIGNHYLIDGKEYVLVGFRMKTSHTDPSEENPIEHYNIETGDSRNLRINEMVHNLVSGEFTIDLDAILEPLFEPKDHYVYKQLESFLMNYRNL